MPKLKIYTYPDVVLTQKAIPISRVDKSLYPLFDDMLETMYYAPGVGLAANQVGILQRICVIDTEYESLDPIDMKPGDFLPDNFEVINGQYVSGKNPIILINPQIVWNEGSATFKEACLSVPNFQSEVKRANRIQLEYQDVNGLTKNLAAEGFQAICIQHEIDHLNGKLFIDRISKLKQDFARKKIIKAKQRNQE
jgi:peptide deformylase